MIIQNESFKNNEYFFFLFIFLLLVVSENLGIYDFGPTSLKRFCHLFLVVAIFFYIYVKQISSKFYTFHKLSRISYIPVLVITFLIISTILHFIFDPSYTGFKFRRLLHWSMLLIVYCSFVFFSRSFDKYNIKRSLNLIFCFVVVVSILSVTDYVLYEYGIYLIKGNSLGTDGKALMREFHYYNYHRLQGFFKEPIFYGAFALPFLAASYYKKSFFVTFIISVSVILTLSLASLLVLVILVLCVLLFGLSPKYRNHSFKYLYALFSGLVLGAFLVFSYPDVPNTVDQNSIFGYLKHRSAQLTLDSFTCTFPDENIIGYLYCKLESLPGRGDSLKYLTNTTPSFFGNGLSSPFVELKVLQTSELFPSIHSGLLALYFQGGLISLFVIFYFIFKQTSLMTFDIKKSSYDPVGFSLFLSFLISFLVYFLILEEPSLVLFAFIGLCVGYFDQRFSKYSA